MPLETWNLQPHLLADLRIFFIKIQSPHATKLKEKKRETCIWTNKNTLTFCLCNIQSLFCALLLTACMILGFLLIVSQVMLPFEVCSIPSGIQINCIKPKSLWRCWHSNRLFTGITVTVTLSKQLDLLLQVLLLLFLRH